jgi:hypothetical protein
LAALLIILCKAVSCLTTNQKNARAAEAADGCRGRACAPTKS